MGLRHSRTRFCVHSGSRRSIAQNWEASSRAPLTACCTRTGTTARRVVCERPGWTGTPSLRGETNSRGFPEPPSNPRAWGSSTAVESLTRKRPTLYHPIIATWRQELGARGANRDSFLVNVNVDAIGTSAGEGRTAALEEVRPAGKPRAVQATWVRQSLRSVGGRDMDVPHE